jgi:hypothetical protein
VNGALKYTDTAYIMYLATLVKCIERAKAFEKQDFGGVRVAHLFSFLCCVVSVSLFVYVRPVPCIPNVNNVPGYSIRHSLFMFVLCLVFPMLTMSLGTPFVILCLCSSCALYSQC